VLVGGTFVMVSRTSIFGTPVGGTTVNDFLASIYDLSTGKLAQRPTFTHNILPKLTCLYPCYSAFVTFLAEEKVREKKGHPRSIPV
jgi:hypothetical protein